MFYMGAPVLFSYYTTSHFSKIKAISECYIIYLKIYINIHGDITQGPFRVNARNAKDYQQPPEARKRWGKILS